MKEIFPAPDPLHIKKERIKAKKLKTSLWWKEKLQKGLCFFCKKTFSPEQLTMEHLVPLARGGFSSKNNLATACKRCNTEKKHQTIVERRLKTIKDQ